MSEQADSFHVRCDRIEAAVAWLEDSRALGLVLQRVGTLVTVFVAPRHVGSVIAASHFLAVFYEFIDGQRVSARLYDGPREIAHLERSFEGKQTSRFEPDVWIKQRIIDKSGAKTLAKGLRAPWPDRHERHWVADTLGLVGVPWSSGEELMTLRPELIARFPGSILVEAGDPKLDAEIRRPIRAAAASRAEVTPPPSVVVTAARNPTPAPILAPMPTTQRTPAPTPAPILTPIQPRAAEPVLPPLLPPLQPRAAEPRLPPAQARVTPPAATAVRPRVVEPPSTAAPLAFLDDFDSGPIQSRPVATGYLPLTDEFGPDFSPPPPVKKTQAATPAVPVLVNARSLVLCSMSKQRQKLLREDPTLADTLIDARHEEIIPGLLDLGGRANDLAIVLASAGKDLLEALRATTSRAIPGARARLLDARAVVRIAALFSEVDRDAMTRAASHTQRLSNDLRALFTLYTDAAANGHAILIAVE